jgi:hypothetical protein
MTGLWWCLTPLVLVVGAALALDERKQDWGPSYGASAVIFVPLWWALYWAIRIVAGT